MMSWSEQCRTWSVVVASVLVVSGTATSCEEPAGEGVSDVDIEASAPAKEPKLGSPGATRSPGEGEGARADTLVVAGAVEQPFSLTGRDLRRFESVDVRLNDVNRSAEFRGVFELRGVPLRALLEQARVVKRSPTFGRELDLAIVARSRDGGRAVLSWGEVFYRDPAEIVIAYEGAARMPRKACADCHEPSTYRPWLDQLEREVGFPKLVVASDFYADRSLENLVAVEVVDLGGEVGIHVSKADRPPELFSGEIRVDGPGVEPAVIRSLDRYARIEADAIQAGDGTGYHGVRHYSGALLREVLAGAGLTPDPSTGLVLSAPDGYRIFLASAEVFDPARSGRLVLADRMNGEPLERGRFQLVPLDDLAADRWLKAIARIDVVRAESRARLLVVGVGPGDTSLITLEAIARIAEADVLVAPGDIVRRFETYLGGREVLFDQIAVHYFGHGREPAEEDTDDERAAARAESVRRIREALDSGKTVALLDYGDPAMLGTWRFLREGGIRTEEIEIVPGVSSVTAAVGSLVRDIGDWGALVVTTPRDIEVHPELARAAAEGGQVLAVMIGLKDIDRTAALLATAFPAETPAAIAYEVGYRSEERVVRTTLGELAQIAKADPEKHLGVVFVGREL